MKTKNISLTIIAFTFAIGSAFVSIFAPDRVHVFAKKAAADIPTCYRTNKFCTQTTDTNKRCRVTFDVTKPGVVTQTVVSSINHATLRPFQDLGCTTVLYDVNDADQINGRDDLEEKFYEIIAH